MKNLSPGQTIKDKVDKLGITLYRLALNMGYKNPVAFYPIASDKVKIGKVVAGRLSANLGETTNRWLRLQKEYDLSLMKD